MNKILKYSQSICAQNLMTSLKDVDKLIDQGMKHIHLDFMDFHYTKTFGLNIETALFLKNRYKNVIFDAHLMVDNPYELIKKLDFLDIIFLPAKKWDEKLHKNVKHKNVNLQFEADDEIEKFKNIIKKTQNALVMTINKIGGTGQQLNSALCKKSLLLKKINPNIKTFSDGGLRADNIHIFQKNKFDVSVGGSIINDFIEEKDFIDFFEGKRHV